MAEQSHPQLQIYNSDFSLEIKYTAPERTKTRMLLRSPLPFSIFP